MVDVDVAPWLASLPPAPVFHPTEEEFVDPIAYILKIEKEASQYGICKIIPPFSRAPENTVLSNLNASLAASPDAGVAPPGSCSIHGASVPLARSMCSAVGEGDARVVMPQNVDSPAKFTTRRQQLGWNPRRPRGGSQYRAQKLVWESGEYYTIEQFEDKAKSFSSSLLGTCEDLSPLVVETLFWNAEFAKPISIEYANDIPGSAFLESPGDEHDSDVQSQIHDSEELRGRRLANSGWNIRNIARSHGSLLKFMPDEVPGVTTPMVYLGMLFSWFAWHVEDHELHSLNYLHTGARKTWYAVPSDAASALEEVIRLYGYGNRLKPRAAFTLLGEKTTILSPEVLVAAGVPCCRLVQNPGEYVITFPRAYHLGFSHGFNCGEAANFATPAWLDVAREAAARRASMNHLPMLSHEQLLYLFTMSLPKILGSPQLVTSGLDLKSSQVEDALRSAFINEVKQNNTIIAKLLEIGVEGCIFLKDYRALYSGGGGVIDEHADAQTEQQVEARNEPHVEAQNEQAGGTNPSAQEAAQLIRPKAIADRVTDSELQPQNRSTKSVCVESRALSPDRYDGLSDGSRIAPLPTPWGALPCAACGILCFASMALVQPSSAPTLSSRQRKHKGRTGPSPPTLVEPSDEACETRPRPSPSVQDKLSQYSGICQLNSAHEEPDAADADLIPEMSSLSDDNMQDSEPPQAMTICESSQANPSSLELLAETYKDDSEEEFDQVGAEVRPDGIISSDEVGATADAPWLVARDDCFEMDMEVVQQDSRSIQLEAGVDSKSLSEIFVSRGLWVGGEGDVVSVASRDSRDISERTDTTESPVATEKTELDAIKEPPNKIRAPVCSFNCESNNLFSANDQDEDCSVIEAEVAEASTKASESRGEEFQFCASNEVPSLDSDAIKTIGSWSFLKGSARPFVFCLEHALEAVTQLQSLGGATVLVICHPNHEVIQQKAEELARKMDFTYEWQKLPLRAASEAEVEIINKAIHLKIDNALGLNWSAKMGVGNRRTKRASVNLEERSERLEANIEPEEQQSEADAKIEAEKKLVLGRWCGRQWKASQVHPLLGGGKSTAHLLSQMLRRCEVQKRLQPMKITSSIAGLASFSKSSLVEKPLKKIRKESWDQQERVLTAAILRKSKRNAVLKTAREGRRKRMKYDELQARFQQTSSTLTQYGLCRQAVFALECNTNEVQQGDQGSAGTNRLADWQRASENAFNPAMSSTSGACQRNSTFQSDLDSTELVKWHEVPVACSPSLRPSMQFYSEWPNDRVSPTAICSTSHQDTGFDEMQVWDQGASTTPTGPSERARKLVVRLKRKCTGGQALAVPKRTRIECVENSSDELDNLIERSPDSHSGLCERSAVDYDGIDQAEEDEADDDADADEVVDLDGGESGSSDSDEYSLRAGSGSDSSPPKALPCFAASRKRSSSKSRVKRATWENLLNRLASPQKEEELAVLQNQDSFPLSCVTETGWDGFECGTYRTKLRPRSSSGLQGDETPPGTKPKKQAPVKRAGGGAKAASAADELDDVNNPFPCDIEGCTMSFNSEQELAQHKKNKCTFKGCGKRFFSHKYLVQHRRVHMDDRPLKCPWQGCTMSFKWAWARTEHIRVHTGERPYACPECDKTFRFVSDFSRHKRNTGHARA